MSNRAYQSNVAVDPEVADEIHALPSIVGSREDGTRSRQADALSEHRSLLVAEMKVKGYSNTAIAEKLGISELQVQQQWGWVKRKWADARNEFIQQVEVVELAKLDALESELWQSFRQSKVTPPTMELIDGQIVMTDEGGEDGPGDPRWLAEILRVMADRAKRLGLYKTEKATGELADSVRKILEIPENASSADAIRAIANAVESFSTGANTQN